MYEFLPCLLGSIIFSHIQKHFCFTSQHQCFGQYIYLLRFVNGKVEMNLSLVLAQISFSTILNHCLLIGLP